jgi:general secretion pathway protein B
MASKTADERDPVSITQAKPAGVPDDRSGSVGSSTAKPTSRAPQFIGTDRDPEPIPRTPVEQIEQASAPVRIPGEARTAQPGSSTAEDLEAASRAIERAVADVERQAEQPASPRSDPADTEAAARNLSAAAVSGRRNYIDFWELPDNVRSDLPEMRLSVMVYAEQPEDRFVLLNGQRLYEGDELQPGLVVSEVRRDGVIFSFRRYRFIYPQ